MKLSPTLIAGTAAFALLVSPAAAQAAGDQSQLRLPMTASQVDTLNPFTAIMAQSLEILDYEYDTLVGRTPPAGDYGGKLAEDFSVDGTTWTFTLKPDLKWSDGEALTAEDVAWTYNAVMDNAPLQKADGNVVEGLVSVTATDERTVEMVTEAPTAVNPGLLRIVPEHIWGDLDAPQDFVNDSATVGSGPFQLSQYQAGTSVVMTKNEHYWGGEPGVDALVFTGYKNDDAKVLALRNGEIDMLPGMNASHYKSLEGVDGITRNQVLSKHFWNISINPGTRTQAGELFGEGNPALQDQAFRQAIRQGMNTEQLVDKVLEGLGSTGPTMFPPGSPGGFYSDYEDIAVSYDPKAAAASLDAAGYPLDAAGKRLGKDGKPITLQLMFDASSTQNSSSAQFMQSWLKDLGITLELKGTNWGEMLDLVPQGKYDMYVSGWDVSGDPDYMLSINTCATLPESPGASSPSQDYMCDPEFDKLYTAQHVETDPEKRIDLVHQAMERHYAFASNLNLYYDDALEAYRSDRLTNLVEMNGSELNYWSIAQVQLQDDAGSGGVPGWVFGVGGGVLVVAVAGVALAAVRRKKTAADRR